MIFKIIIENCQTSNTSASQNNNKRQHQKTFRIFEQARKFLWGWDFPKTKTPDTDVILTPSYPQSESIVLCGPRRRQPGWDLEDETCVRQKSNYYVEMTNCMITFLVNFKLFWLKKLSEWLHQIQRHSLNNTFSSLYWPSF